LKLFISLLLLLSGIGSGAYAQSLTEKGIPLLRNFTPKDYNHRGKIWDIDSAPNGIVYMAADKGLIEYDGTEWKGFSGSNGVVRSVMVASDTLIYTGSDLDFGVWNRNKFNKFEYTSLYPFQEDLNQLNEEFWNIHELNGNIFFVSSSNIYVFTNRNRSLTKIPVPNDIDNSFVINGQFYFIDQQEGLFQLQNLSPVKLSSFGENKGYEIIGIYEQQETLVFVTQNSGLYAYSSGDLIPLNTSLSESLKSANVFSFEVINDSFLAFGTILNGVYISDMSGNVAHSITKNKGLNNNTILSLHYSDIGKLWLAMDFGVAFLDLSNEFTFFYDYLGDFGTGYSAFLENGDFYLGSNQGLYKSDWEELNNSSELDDFELIQGTEGQVWTLNKIDDTLLMGHDRGLFKIEGTRLVRIGNQRGIWTLKKYGEYLFAGTYNGISIYKKDGGDWVYHKNMELILGSSNQIIIEGQNTIWINIPNFGVIRATLDGDLYPQNREIFESQRFGDRDHYLEQSDNGVKVVTDEFEYSYDSDSNGFSKEKQVEAGSGVDDLLMKNGRPQQLNDEYMFYPAYNGFALRRLDQVERVSDTSPQLIYRQKIAYSNDDEIEIYNGAEISYKMNNLNIVSNVPNRDDVMYQYKTGESNEWSNWSSEGTFSLVGIGYGEHNFTARAMVGMTMTPETSFSFIISTPWYRSWPALIFYFIALSLAFYMMYMWQGMSLSKQKKYLLKNQRNSLREQKERYRRQLQEVEEDKLRAEYEKMKAQLKSKTIELATKAKENDEKQKILQTLNEKIERLKKNPDSVKRQSDEIQRIIDSHIDSEDNTFEIQIDELHQEFSETLRKEYPDLTRYDLRLCVYIKMGFDSKEISDLLNIKPSSVYISRSRLRKKIDIDSDEDLHAFLNSVLSE